MASQTHLVILIHGAWGNPSHLQYLHDTLTQTHQAEVDAGTLQVFLPKANSGTLTYDGIEVGAERITAEIEQTIDELTKEGREVTQISFTGYSMGGLTARYIVGLLHKDGVFDTVEPINFTTFATPHLGIRTPRNDYGSAAWDFLGARSLNVSGQQMFLTDNFRGSDRSLLDIMADPTKVFLQGLKRFKHKTAYANTLNDRSVPFYTAAISRVDPFVDLDAIDVKYMDGQGDSPVLLDPNDPVTLRAASAKATSRYFSPRTLSSIPFYAALCTAIPIVVPLFMANAGYQTYQSMNRIKLHETDSASDRDRFRIPLLEEAQAAQEKIVERVAAEQPEEYLPTPPPESAASPAPDEDSGLRLAREQSHKTDSPFPTLALTKEQFDMIDGLESTGIVKYAAHILKVRRTHAAIVVRSPKQCFDEGRVVVKHWANAFVV